MFFFKIAESMESRIMFDSRFDCVWVSVPIQIFLLGRVSLTFTVTSFFISRERLVGIRRGITGEEAGTQSVQISDNTKGYHCAKVTAIRSHSQLRTPYTSRLNPLFLPHSDCGALNPSCTHHPAHPGSSPPQRSARWPPQSHWKTPTHGALRRYFFFFTYYPITLSWEQDRKIMQNLWGKRENREWEKYDK